MKTVALLLAACAAIQASAMSFDAFTVLHGKKYASKDEYELRRGIFALNKKMIEEHNAKGETYTLGLNEFADLTHDEFTARYVGGWRGPTKRVNPVAVEHLMTNVTDLPASVDWTAKGAVTPIKNQGQCGSCWAFSTTGSVEGITFISTGTLPSLSEQQLVDCSGSAGNQGCNGGLMDNAFKWIIQNGGICSESEYPYKAAQGTCQTCTPVATISGYTDVPVKNEDAMMSAVAQQPVSIAIQANQLAFQFYSGGVFTAACGTQLDHGVLAVGYGTESGTDYWKVKNSWGPSWGEAGYILLQRGGNLNGGAGQCGLLTTPSYPTK
jgi:C1A family cysteine protease